MLVSQARGLAEVEEVARSVVADHVAVEVEVVQTSGIPT